MNSPSAVQIAADHAKNDVTGLASVEPPVGAGHARDPNATLGTLPSNFQAPEQIDGSETREIQLKMRSGTLDFNGQDFLTQFAVPNLYFHTTTAYDILHQSGVDIGKADFLGGK